MADKVYAKHYSIGPSNNQVITLLILAAAGGAAAMYFVPQLPNYIMGLFKGTETPKSVIEKIKVDAAKPKTKTTNQFQFNNTRPPTTPSVPRTPPKSAATRNARYTYY